MVDFWGVPIAIRFFVVEFCSAGVLQCAAFVLAFQNCYSWMAWTFLYLWMAAMGNRMHTRQVCTPCGLFDSVTCDGNQHGVLFSSRFFRGMGINMLRLFPVLCICCIRMICATYLETSIQTFFCSMVQCLCCDLRC